MPREVSSSREIKRALHLVSRYLGDQGAARDHALAQVGEMLSNLPALLAAVGVEAKGKRSAR